MGGVDIDACDIIQCDKDYPVFPKSLNLPLGDEDENLRFWSFFQSHMVQLNESTEAYIKKEIDGLNINEKVLGTLIRGTDYTKAKPYGHPIQPSVDEVIERIEQYLSEKSYDAVYVATEEERIFNRVMEALGSKCRILSNKRRYYDKLFYENNYDWIAQVHFADDDYFEKGIAYLSSLYILSNCGGIVAGDCGGTGYVMTLPHQFQDVYIFDKGRYGIDE